MLQAAVVFLILGLMVALLGFTGFAGTAIAQILVVVFLVLSVIGFGFGRRTRA